MTTEIITETFLETALKKYTVTEADIATLSDECMALKVASVVDKEGYKIVKKAHSSIRRARVEVEDKRRELKKESLDFGRGVDARAKELTALITPIEEHLVEQKKIIEDEELRIVNENARIAQEVIDKAEAIKKKEEEDRQAQIKADQETENKRLEGIRKEQEAKGKELQDKEDKIDAKNKQIADDKIRLELEAQKKIDIAKAQEDARAEAEKEQERLKEEKAEKDKALKIALDYATAILPDNEKLKALADTIDAIKMPALSHDNSHIVLGDAKIYLEKACKTLRQ